MKLYDRNQWKKKFQERQQIKDLAKAWIEWEEEQHRSE